jgi:hypothetical protein
MKIVYECQTGNEGNGDMGCMFANVLFFYPPPGLRRAVDGHLRLLGSVAVRKARGGLVTTIRTVVIGKKNTLI